MTSNPEQEGSDDLHYKAEYVLQYAPRNLIITKRHLLEYLPRYVLEYVPIGYDKHRGTYRGIYSGTYQLVMVLVIQISVLPCHRVSVVYVQLGAPVCSPRSIPPND